MYVCDVHIKNESGFIETTRVQYGPICLHDCWTKWMMQMNGRKTGNINESDNSNYCYSSWQTKRQLGDRAGMREHSTLVFGSIDDQSGDGGSQL